MKKNLSPLAPEAALLRAQKLCASREVSAQDMRRKLHDWGIISAEAEKIIQQLQKGKFIDDRRFAMAAVQDKFRFNKWGSYKIKQFLRAKGIPDPLIREALATIDENQKIELIEKLLIAKNRSIKRGLPLQRKAKLLRFAQSRGFEIDSIMQIIDKLVP